MGARISSLMERRDKLPPTAVLASPFPLLSLPREIRNLIYEFALTSYTGNVYAFGTYSEVDGIRHPPYTFTPVHPITYRHQTSDSPPGPSIALLQTCSQIYSEAITYFYTLNTFSIHPLTREVQLCKATQRIRHIQNTGIVGLEDPMMAVATLLVLKDQLEIMRGMPNLETVTVRILSEAQEMEHYQENCSPEFVAMCIDVLKQDCVAWKELLEEEALRVGKTGIMKTRKVTRRLEVSCIKEQNLTRWTPKLRELNQAFGGELWFLKRSHWLNMTEFVESVSRAVLSPAECERI